jgi:hypothetical protein
MYSADDQVTRITLKNSRKSVLSPENNLTIYQTWVRDHKIKLQKMELIFGLKRVVLK